MRRTRTSSTYSQSHKPRKPRVYTVPIVYPRGTNIVEEHLQVKAHSIKQAKEIGRRRMPAVKNARVAPGTTLLATDQVDWAFIKRYRRRRIDPAWLKKKGLSDYGYIQTPLEETATRVKVFAAIDSKGKTLWVPKTAIGTSKAGE